MDQSDLPITDVLAPLISALSANGCAVLQAPPGAGKTTLVPLAMLDARLCEGRIFMLEPRRLAARAAAERMASLLGEKAGQTVGYRIRGESKSSRTTRIEVVTEGILTRMIQSDPELPGVGAVIFDEFHERSLNGDLGLALTWEARNALRPDLLIVVMSATLDAEPVARMLGDAPVITSDGRAFDVQTHWLDRPVPKTTRFENSAVDLVLNAVNETIGGVLVFLPGEGEIRRTEQLLRGVLPADCQIMPLYGSMDFRAQRAAIAPLASGRKVVLATSIAETSLTIEDIRVVVDCGRARRARFDPGAGMSRLVTERVTKAEAHQRRGRAGRVTRGHCYRLWTKGEEGGMAPFPPPEIEAADLSGLVLELALWGVTAIQAIEEMAFLTPPNPGAFDRAQDLLRTLGALDDACAITPQGRKLAAIPLHPRLGHMLLQGGKSAALLAALLADRDPLRGAGVDLMARKSALENPGRFDAKSGEELNRDVAARIRAEASRLARFAPAKNTELGWPQLAALAFPDRIGMRRQGSAPRWVLSGGKGAVMNENDPMAGAPFIVATDLDGDATQAKIRSAAQLSLAQVRDQFANQISRQNSCEWSQRERRVVARSRECLGALVLAEESWGDAPAGDVRRAALDGFRDLGLVLGDAARRFQARVELVRGGGERLPDMSMPGLMARLDEWLLPHLGALRTQADIRRFDLLEPMRQNLNWEQQRALDRLAPAHFITPMGHKCAIDYGGELPEISVRLQEMFGVTRHPTIGPDATPLRVTLLSPARRPVQTTTDLPGFWANSYVDVRKDMRGQYPRHPWPDDPKTAQATLRAKPRKK